MSSWFAGTRPAGTEIRERHGKVVSMAASLAGKDEPDPGAGGLDGVR